MVNEPAWDPRLDHDLLSLSRVTVFVGLLLALFGYYAWKLLMRFLERRRTSINWRRLRLWWPSAMLGWGWALAALYAFSWGWTCDALFFVFAFFNFPSLLLAVVIGETMTVAIPASVWVRLVGCSLVLWIGDYLLVCVAERRAWRDVPLSLGSLNLNS